jgi:hypothetical protein
MKSRLTLAVVLAFAIAPICVASVQGGTEATCPNAATPIYTNEGSTAINFNLSVGWSTQNGGCPLTVSWKDASGHQQKIELPYANSMIVATSLPAHGSISISTTENNGSYLDTVSWQIEPR